MIRAPSLTLAQLEQRAGQLLTEYSTETTGSEVPTVVPLSEIAENHIGLRIEFKDMHEYCGVPKRGNTVAILGLMDFERREILIDQSLDPDIFPLRIGRYRYTLAHEIGHWQLHRSIALKLQARTGQAPIICRDVDQESAPPIEQQANHFASFFLLPRERVLDAWGDRPPCVFDVFELGSQQLQRYWLRSDSNPVAAMELFSLECEKYFDQVVAPLAWQFQVSNQAMRIRLEGFGLLRRARWRRARRLS